MGDDMDISASDIVNRLSYQVGFVFCNRGRCVQDQESGFEASARLLEFEHAENRGATRGGSVCVSKQSEGRTCCVVSGWL